MISISNSGESTAVLRALEAAKSAGATTLSITNSEKSSAAQLSDYHITTATREKLFLDGYCFSRVSATTVIEILYLFLTSMRKDAYKSIVRHEPVSYTHLITIKIRRIILWTLFTEDVLLVVIRMIKIYEHAQNSSQLTIKTRGIK